MPRSRRLTRRESTTAITARDGAAAENAMRLHLSNVAQTLRARVRTGGDDAVVDGVA
jgi:DNA-binding FadR family transcriptional regulator